MTPLSKADLMTHLHEYLQATPLPDELWVFAYGSLLWNPEMTIVDTQPATIKGYERGFNLLSTAHRGTIDNPGLVLSLRPGSYCEGLAFQVCASTKKQDFTKLWLREMVSMFYLPTWIKASTHKGDIDAITFVANPKHPQFVDYDPSTTANMIASASGGRGNNIDYFYNTQASLAALDIKDTMMDEIAKFLPH